MQHLKLEDLRTSLPVMFAPENPQGAKPEKRVGLGRLQKVKGVTKVYILTELITGGELHGAIREIPTVLSRPGFKLFQSLVCPKP